MTRFLAFACLLSALAACNTVKGVGQDLSAGGAAISSAAANPRWHTHPDGVRHHH